MLPICLCLPNKAFQPTTYARHDALAVQTRQHNGIDQHAEYKFFWFHVPAWPGCRFPPCLGLRVLTLASLCLTQSLNLPWASNSKDWPNRDLVAGTFGSAAMIRGTRLGVWSDQGCSNARLGKSSSGPLDYGLMKCICETPFHIEKQCVQKPI
jgi:hypothetical protein